MPLISDVGRKGELSTTSKNNCNFWLTDIWILDNYAYIINIIHNAVKFKMADLGEDENINQKIATQSMVLTVTIATTSI